MDQKRNRNARSGFTLIEVLVVVAIIALLIAILLPSLSRAREQARQAACSANLHQMGLAMEMYVSQYGCFVPVATDKGEYGRWLRLIGNLYSKRNEAKRSPITTLGVCPSVPEYAQALKIQNHRMDRDIAYGYNYQYLGDSRTALGRFPVKSSQIKSPSRMIAIADSDGTGGWCPNPNPYNPAGADPNAMGHHGFMIDPPRLPPEAEIAAGGNGPAFKPEKCTMSSRPGFARVSNRHPGGAGVRGARVLYVDGHVEYVDRRLLEREDDNSPWNGWRRDP